MNALDFLAPRNLLPKPPLPAFLDKIDTKARGTVGGVVKDVNRGIGGLLGTGGKEPAPAKSAREALL
jgi:hypothetical protein